jgi:hypothetical protein
MAVLVTAIHADQRCCVRPEVSKAHYQVQAPRLFDAFRALAAWIAVDKPRIKSGDGHDATPDAISASAGFCEKIFAAISLHRIEISL